jgi:hypothetical protein
MLSGNYRKTTVVPAQAGTQRRSLERRWIPASAGMTANLECVVSHFGDAQQVGIDSMWRADE